MPKFYLIEVGNAENGIGNFADWIVIRRQVLTCVAGIVCYLKIWWSFDEGTWSHCLGTMLILMKLWRFDVTQAKQALYACPLYGSIMEKQAW